MYVLTQSQIRKALSQKPTQGKHALEPISSLLKKNKIPVSIIEDYRTISTPEVHMKFADVWHCLQGQVTFTIGGSLIKPFKYTNKKGRVIKTEIRGKRIHHGKKIILKTGEWLWIPPNTPHQHATRSVARMLVIKIPT